MEDLTVKRYGWSFPIAVMVLERSWVWLLKAVAIIECGDWRRLVIVSIWGDGEQYQA